MMKISIVTPSYNQADYIPICIRSVLKQTYENIEFIIVDGCSSDSSVEILKDFSIMDKRIKFISERDTGQGEAVNKGFEMVTGDIVAWINSDDFYFDENVFKFVCDFFVKNPSIDILYGGMAYVDSKNALQHIRIPPKYNYEMLTMISYIGNTNAFYRRSVIDRHKLEPDFHFVIDHEYMLRITKDFSSFRTKRILASFRVHEDAKTQTMSNETKDIERERRNKSHDIKISFIFKLNQILFRIFYKLQLFITDLRFLSFYQKNIPYKNFLN